MVDVALQQLPEADGRHAIMGGLPHRNREEVGRGRSFSPNWPGKPMRECPARHGWDTQFDGLWFNCIHRERYDRL